MLKNIYISNYALIEQLDLPLDKGLIIITGETGAGKSILLGALSLILGQRADASALKDDTKKCVIEGVFNIADYDIKPFFEENDLDYAAETIVRREINIAGKSRAFINDTPATLNVLKDFGNQLVDIHSQHETLLLKEKKFILSLIDAYADNEKNLSQYREQYLQYLQLEKKLQALQNNHLAFSKKLDFNQFLYEELQKSKIIENEQDKLEEEIKALSHGEEIKSALNEGLAAFNNDETDIISLLNKVEQQFERVGQYYNPIKEMLNRIKSARIELEDINIALQNANENIDFDPQRLTFVQQRLDLLYTLQQKHNVNNNAALLEVEIILKEKIETTINFDDELKAVASQLEKQKNILNETAGQLSKKRADAAKPLTETLNKMLGEVGLENAKVKFEFEQIAPTSTGIDNITLLFSANKGSNLQPIQKVASGGELSRLMLCVKAVKAAHQKLPTIIFDEIDTGVSGKIAHKVGEILKKMAASMQVLAITHLPQIAAKAQTHLFVFKEIIGNQTISKIKSLNKDERINELAKMLSSDKVSETAIENARLLIEE